MTHWSTQRAMLRDCGRQGVGGLSRLEGEKCDSSERVPGASGALL